MASKPPAITLEGEPAADAVPDTMSTTATATTDTDTTPDDDEVPRASVDLDELPIELVSLADSFVESLQARVNPAPPTIDSLSQRFQDFYATAFHHVGTHIAALASRQTRGAERPAPSTRASASSLFRARGKSLGGKDKPVPEPNEPKEETLPTADEQAARRRARRALEAKRVRLEEAVERRLCEGLYDRLYRHRTTHDEAQDEKLRSKVAALDVVGIGPADLGVDLGVAPDASAADVHRKVADVRHWLAPARQQLVDMGAAHYPLGKLNRLKAAHKHIVDTLAHFHPSSSADEIMPMLIYTLITLPPEQLNVVSDLNFVQRFRWEPKIEGEAAYCLTNLEASISFIETVDLSTLRADETPSGPAKGPATNTNTTDATAPAADTFPPAYFAQQGLTVPSASPSAPQVSADNDVKPFLSAPSAPSASTAAGLVAAVQMRNRRLSDLVNTPAHALSSASDAVMNTFSAADQGFKTIGNSLEGSYRLLVGRLGSKDGALAKAPHATVADILPRTLADARKLVTTPPPADDDLAPGDQSVQDKTPVQSVQDKTPPPKQTLRRIASGMDDRMLQMLGGRKAVSRDPSVDSARSAGSSVRRTLPTADDDTASASATATASTPASASTANPALLDSVRSLGTSFNPMARLSNMGGFRGFGRTQSTPAQPASSSPGTNGPEKDRDKDKDGVDLATAFPDIAAALPPKPPPTIAPPVKRFMELHNPGDLRIGEVMELLRDYRRLATALKDRGAFKD